jgi:hypothetical protein
MVFGAVAVLGTLLLGPFAVVLLSVGLREPWLFAFGICGIAGLVGGAARIWLGSRFFALGSLVRLAIGVFIALGVTAALLAPAALPRSLYWATVAPLVGIAGLVLLAGSVTSSAPGPNCSVKRQAQ